MRTRADQIFESFVRFHKENPRVWRLFERFAFQRFYEERITQRIKELLA